MGASRQGLRGRGHANDGGQRLCSAPSQMMELAVKAYAGACVRNHLLRQSLTSRLTRVRASSATICLRLRDGPEVLPVYEGALHSLCPGTAAMSVSWA